MSATVWLPKMTNERMDAARLNEITDVAQNLPAMSSKEAAKPQAEGTVTAKDGSPVTLGEERGTGSIFDKKF